MRKLSPASLAAIVLLGLPVAPLLGAAAPADGAKPAPPAGKVLRVDCRNDYLSCARGCNSLITFSAGNMSSNDYKKCAHSCNSDRNQCEINSGNLQPKESLPPDQVGPQVEPQQVEPQG